jgi:cell wall-associated NlpC family hydrolase
MHRWASAGIMLGTLVVTGCAAHQGPRPFPGAPGAPVAPPAETAALPPPAKAPTATSPIPPHAALDTAVPAPWVTSLLTTALALRGTPYRLGGNDTTGFDCSGFVRYVFAQFGHQLPREVHAQFKVGRPIARDEILAGDLVFFETVSKGASHVGIALGNDEFVHAPSSRGVVRTERYTVQYWASRWIGARRWVDAQAAQ